MMLRHFLDLEGAAILDTAQYQLAGRIIDDLIDNSATGVIHGPAGTGKTFAVGSHLADVSTQVVTCTMAFQSKPTMRQVLVELHKTVGGAPPVSKNRFELTSLLVELLSGPPRLLVVDEAQRLNGDCIELIRHLHDHPETRFALLYVGGDGCWEVLSREPMLRSRVFRRLPFRRLDRSAIPNLIREYHTIYTEAEDRLLLDIDDTYTHGILRDWAVFTHTAADVCHSAGRERIDREVIDNTYALLGGGVSG